MMRPVLAVLIVCLSVQYCDSIRCYECLHGSSSLGTYAENCGEDFDESGISTVNCNNGGCYKIYGKSDAGVGILRGCEEDTNDTSDGCVTGSNAEGEGAACICFSDLCNTGSRTVAIPTSLVLGLTTFGMMMWRLG